MSDTQVSTPSADESPRNIWMRGLLMIVMALAFHLASMLLGLLAVVQFILVLVPWHEIQRGKAVRA